MPALTNSPDHTEALETARWALEHAVKDLSGPRSDNAAAAATVERCNQALEAIEKALKNAPEPDFCWLSSDDVEDSVDWEDRAELFDGSEDVIEAQCAKTMPRRYLAEVIVGMSLGTPVYELQDFPSAHAAQAAIDRGDRILAGESEAEMADGDTDAAEDAPEDAIFGSGNGSDLPAAN